MSLLPGRILPQTEPFGTLSEDGKTVTIGKNWWLLFYNMALQSIGTGVGIPADQLIDLESVDIDAVGVSAAALRAPLQALANLLPSDGDPVPSLQDVQNALLLAYSALDAVDAIVSGFAPPTAKVGLTATPGTALTAMRSDAAPPIDQAIAPIWTGNHIFTPAAGVAIAINAPGASGAALTMTYQSVNVAASAYTTWQRTTTVVGFAGAVGTAGDLIHGSLVGDFTVGALTGNLLLSANTAVGFGLKLSTTNATLAGPLGVSGNTPPAQVTGFGTPTGPVVVANFPGATATLVQCSNTIAEIIKDLKAFGLYGA